MDDEVSQQIASLLGIAWLSLSDRRTVYQSAVTYMEQGAVIKGVLEMIPLDRSLSHRLLTAGFIAGLWGRPKRWDPG
jgi:fructose-1,6-bisphosphatase/sedoheptulose 1,7-bisphosphatase-like protein